jgi:hypothetical protein
VLWHRATIQKVDLNDGLATKNGESVQIPNAYNIFGIDFLKSNEELLFVVYHDYNISHCVALYNWSNLNAALAFVKIGESLINMRIIEIYPKLENQNICMMKVRRFDEVNEDVSANLTNC